MAPKKSKKEKKASVDEEESEKATKMKSPTPVQSDGDIYKNYRFRPPVQQRTGIISGHPTMKREVHVLKRRQQFKPAYKLVDDKIVVTRTSIVSEETIRFPSTNFSQSAFKVDSMTLNPNTLKGTKWKIWQPPNEKRKQPTTALVRQMKDTKTVEMNLSQSEHKESNSLSTFVLEKRKQLDLENYLMKKTNRTRGDLLLRTYQVLPRIDQKGRECQAKKREDFEPLVKEDIWQSHHIVTTSKGLVLTMTRREPGYNVVTEWLGAPSLTDPIANILGTIPGTENSIQHQELTQQQCGPDTMKCDSFVPLFPALAVVGTRCTIRERKSARHRDKRPKPPQYQDERESTVIDFPPTPHKKSILVWFRQSGGLNLLFGGNILTWQEDLSDIEQENYVVEVGCSAELGSSGVSSTKLTNVGTVVINYTWSQCTPEKKIHPQHYKETRFYFDFMGGSLLPGETHVVPCLYRAKDPGHFTEDWRLNTQPVVAGGKPVILRIWGITLLGSQSRSTVSNIQKTIQTMAGKTVCKHQMHKIMDNLPLTDCPYKETRFPLVLEGPDLFLQKNPGFHYHSAAVYRLARLANFLSPGGHATETPFHSSDFSTSIASEIELQTVNRVMKMREGDRGDPSAVRSVATDITVGHSLKSMDANTFETTVSTSYQSSYGLYEDEEENNLGEIEDKLISQEVGKASSTTTAPRLTNYRFGEVDFRYLYNYLMLKTDIDHCKEQMMRKVQIALADVHKVSSNIERSVALTPPVMRSLSPTKRDYLPAKSPTTSKSNFASHEAARALSETGKLKASFVNFVDPNVSIRAMRHSISKHPNSDVCEASFYVMNEAVSKLCFRTPTPIDSWKMVTGITYLCFTIDAFSEYALRLKSACCMSQAYERGIVKKKMVESKLDLEDDFDTDSDHDSDLSPSSPRMSVPGADLAEDTDNDSAGVRDKNASRDNTVETPQGNSLGTSKEDLLHRNSFSPKAFIQNGTPSTKSGYSPANEEDDTPDLSNIDDPDEYLKLCGKMPPREALTEMRYNSHYYDSLYSRMYELLAAYVDEMDTLWSSDTPEISARKSIPPCFNKVRSIPRKFNIEGFLEVPGVPKWVKKAVEIRDVAKENAARMQDV